MTCWKPRREGAFARAPISYRDVPRILFRRLIPSAAIPEPNSTSDAGSGTGAATKLMGLVKPLKV